MGRKIRFVYMMIYWTGSRIQPPLVCETAEAKCITAAEEKYEKLLESLDPELSMNYQKRCEEATKEGGKISGPSLGTWNIPTIIEDEDSYRCKILKGKSSSVVQADLNLYKC